MAERRRREERTQEQARYDGPPIPEGITGKELDRSVAAQLRSLPERLALRVSRHLAAAAWLLHSDPETAHGHARAAKARAARVTVVREACGETAYATGDFRAALSEFKAARRLGGGPQYLAMMADCERGLGRPERALDLVREIPSSLGEGEQVEMRIVESGARRDLGDAPGALRALEGPRLRTQSREPWVPRLRYAYAEALLFSGRRQDARVWFERAAAADTDEITDALQRAEELAEDT